MILAEEKRRRMTKQISNLVVCVVCIGFLVACSDTPGMAADKANYRIGEKVTIAVTPLAPCNLTVTLEIVDNETARTNVVVTGVAASK